METILLVVVVFLTVVLIIERIIYFYKWFLLRKLKKSLKDSTMGEPWLIPVPKFLCPRCTNIELTDGKCPACDWPFKDRGGIVYEESE